MAQVGGYAEAAAITDEVKGIVEGLKGEIESKTGKTFATFEGLSFVKQVVAGINYKVKVKVAAEMGVEECIHVLIYCPLPHTGEGPKLVTVEEGKKVDDKIE